MLHLFHNFNRLLRIKNSLEEIYLNLIVQSLAVAMIGIFIPVYLLETGFSLEMVIIYLIIQWASLLLFNPITTKLSSRYGVKHTIMYSVPLMIAVFMMLMVFPLIEPMLLFIVAALFGIELSVYWVPLHTEFIKSSDLIHQNDEVSRLIAIPSIASIVAPIIGALILEAMGFPTLFMIVIVMLFISIIPLFASPDYKRPFGFSLKGMEFGLNSNLSLAYTVQGLVHMSEFLIWPVFILFTFHDLVSIGAVVTFAGLGIGLFTILMGKIGKRVSHRKLLIIGALGYAASWILRGSVVTVWDAFILSFVGGIFISMVNVVIYVSFCELARGRDEHTAEVSREFWLGVGRILSLTLFFVALPALFEFTFIYMGIVPLVLLMVKLK